MEREKTDRGQKRITRLVVVVRDLSRGAVLCVGRAAVADAIHEGDPVRHAAGAEKRAEARHAEEVDPEVQRLRAQQTQTRTVCTTYTHTYCAHCRRVMGGVAVEARGHTWLKMSHESDARFRLRTSPSSSAAAESAAARDSSTCCSCESTECGAQMAIVDMLAIRIVMADAISFNQHSTQWRSQGANGAIAPLKKVLLRGGP